MPLPHTHVENQARGGRVEAHRNLGNGSDRKESGGPGTAGQARMPTQARRVVTLPVPALQSVRVLQMPRDHAALPWAAPGLPAWNLQESRPRHPMW